MADRSSPFDCPWRSEPVVQLQLAGFSPPKPRQEYLVWICSRLFIVEGIPGLGYRFRISQGVRMIGSLQVATSSKHFFPTSSLFCSGGQRLPPLIMLFGRRVGLAHVVSTNGQNSTKCCVVI
jgi:hypothetical protein